MGTRTLIVDFKRGTGDEPFYGYVTIHKTRVLENGTFELLPWSTKVKLRDGIATFENAVTDGTGPIFSSAYRIVGEDACGHRAGIIVALPDGTTPVRVSELPHVSLVTGDGSFVDIDELNALIQQANDTANQAEAIAQSVRDDADAGEFDGAPGNATIRYDTTAGSRLFVTDGTTETLIASTTGWRDVSSLLLPGVTIGTSGWARMKREGNLVYLNLKNVTYSASATEHYVLRGYPIGMRPANGTTVRVPAYMVSSGTTAQLTGVTVRYAERDITIVNRTATPTFGDQYSKVEVSWSSDDSWPTASALASLPVV